MVWQMAVMLSRRSVLFSAKSWLPMMTTVWVSVDSLWRNDCARTSVSFSVLSLVLTRSPVMMISVCSSGRVCSCV